MGLNHILPTLLALFLTFSAFPSWSKDKDCTCVEISCGPCQRKITIGKVVKFCSWGDMNVCRQEVCENVPNFFTCISDHSKEKREKKTKISEILELPYENETPLPQKKKQTSRDLASVKNKVDDQDPPQSQGRIEVGNDSRVITGVDYSESIVAHVKSLSSGLNLFHRGQNQKLKAKHPLFVGDEITNLSEKPETLEITFENGSVHLDLKPKTKLIIEDPYSILGHFQPFIYLVYGGVDFKVSVRQGSFDLLAGQILTRSSSGEFKVHYEMGLEGLLVKAENLKGDLEVLKAGDLSGKRINVQAGAFVNWVSETSGTLFSQNEKQALISEGFITPVFLNPQAKPPLKAPLEDKKDNPFIRGLASSDGTGDFCQAPAAQFQQCSWSCEGNSKSSNNCQADKANVSCVRRVCNAAGQWGAATAFASSYKDLCPAQGVRVGDCSP